MNWDLLGKTNQNDCMLSHAIEEHAEEVYDGIVSICSGSLVALARRGVLGDFNKSDFIFQDCDDNWSTFRDRDLAIRRLLQLTD